MNRWSKAGELWSMPGAKVARIQSGDIRLYPREQFGFAGWFLDIVIVIVIGTGVERGEEIGFGGMPGEHENVYTIRHLRGARTRRQSEAPSKPGMPPSVIRKWN
jgi:hypothetical protein